jgi:putative transcriptional regulator
MASRILEAVHVTAKGLRRAGLMPVQTMREFDALCVPRVQRYTPSQIRRLRMRNRASQAVFAAWLNTTPSTVQKWEQGQQRPAGPSLKLLNIVDRHGLAALR